MTPKSINKNINVVHVIWSASFGGIEKVVMDLCKSQLQLPDTSPSILSGKKEGQFQKQLETSGVPHVYAGFRNGKDLSFKLYKKLRSVFHGADLIHIHTFNPLIALAASTSRKPVLYTIHGNFGFGRKLNKFEKFNKFLLKIFLKNYVAHISCNSKFTQNTAIKHYGISTTNSTIVFNGIPVEHTSSHKTTIQNSAINKLKNKFVIGTTSRFAGFKRIDRLIEAFSFIATKIPDSALLLVGDGILRKKLEEQVNELKLSDKVIFAGYQQDVASYQSAMDVCVFPSENEPFGLVAIETLLLGKPTIVFEDGGGMKEILANTYEEDIVKNSSELCKRILHYYQFPVTDIERENRAKFAKGFGIKKMAQNIGALYIKILS